MTKQKVLIVTHSADNASTELVSQTLREKGIEVMRFDVDRYPLNATLSSTYQNGTWQIQLMQDGKVHDLSALSALWYRRGYNLGQGLNEVLEKKFLGPAFGEIQQVVWGLIESFRCYQLGRVSGYRRMDSKEEQLKIAARIGLRIPDTCITNDPEEARAFIASCAKGAIVKMQRGFALYEDGVEQVVFTNAVDEKSLEEIDTLRYCPMQFQEKIEKEKELRVTIVGDKVFSFEIDSQKMENAKVDWRREGVELIDAWMPCTLPEAVESKLLQLMDVYGVDYGAIDLIKNPEGEYYFLEINAAGEYFWLDRLCDGAISRQIAAVLAGEKTRRGKAAY